MPWQKLSCNDAIPARPCSNSTVFQHRASQLGAHRIFSIHLRIFHLIAAPYKYAHYTLHNSSVIQRCILALVSTMADYNSMKVPELKKLLNERSLPHTGNKADLIARLTENDRQQAANTAAPQAGKPPTPVSFSPRRRPPFELLPPVHCPPSCLLPGLRAARFECGAITRKVPSHEKSNAQMNPPR